MKAWAVRGGGRWEVGVGDGEKDESLQIASDSGTGNQQPKL